MQPLISDRLLAKASLPDYVISRSNLLHHAVGASLAHIRWMVLNTRQEQSILKVLNDLRPLTLSPLLHTMLVH